jgi:hypothetical protein
MEDGKWKRVYRKDAKNAKGGEQVNPRKNTKEHEWTRE